MDFTNVTFPADYMYAPEDTPDNIVFVAGSSTIHAGTMPKLVECLTRDVPGKRRHAKGLPHVLPRLHQRPPSL